MTANLGLARAAARRFTVQARAAGLDGDDLAAEGMLALVRAAERFDPGQGVRFSTYATVCLERWLWKILRRGRKRYLVQLDAGAEDEWGIDAALARSREPDPADGSEHPLSAAAAAVRQMARRERAILELRHGLGPDGKTHTLSAIATLLGLSRDQVNELYRNAKLQLSALMRPDD